MSRDLFASSMLPVNDLSTLSMTIAESRGGLLPASFVLPSNQQHYHRRYCRPSQTLLCPVDFRRLAAYVGGSRSVEVSAQPFWACVLDVRNPSNVRTQVERAHVC